MAGQHLFVWIVMCILLERKISGAVVSHTPSHEVQEQPEEVSNTEGLQQVTVGEPALLPCLLPHPPPSLGGIRVYWQTANTEEVVHVFNKGKEEFEHQSPSYHNRTRLFTSQLPFGNFSLELRNVSEHDNLTTFQCLAFYHGSRTPKYQNTTLLVLKEDVNRSHDDGGTGNSTLTAMAVALLVLISLVLVLVWGVRKCLKKGRDNIHPVRIYFSKVQSGSTERNPQQQDESGSTERDELQQQDESGSTERDELQQQDESGSTEREEQQHEPLVSKGQEGEDQRGEDS